MSDATAVATPAAVVPGQQDQAAQPGNDPWYKGFIRDDGTINRDAFVKMPEGFRTLGDGELKNITNVDQFMQKMQGLSALAGKKALAPLGPNATPEEIQQHTQILRAVNGVPEKPEGYGLARPEDFPAQAWDDNHAKSVSAILHKHNASPALAKELVAAQMELTKGHMKAQEEYTNKFFADQDNAFRETLKKDGIDYDKAMGIVNQTAVKHGFDPNDLVLKNASVRSLLFEVAKSTSEHGFKGGDQQVNLKTSRAQAEEIMHDKSNPHYEAYWQATHPKNAEVKRMVNSLMQNAVKEESAGR